MLERLSKGYKIGEGASGIIQYKCHILNTLNELILLVLLCVFLFLLFVHSIINKCKIGDLKQIHSAIVPEARSLIQRCQ